MGYLYFQSASWFFFFLLLIPERGEKREKEREKNISVTEKHQSVASCMFPDWQLNTRPFSFQDDTQPAEPNQPRLSASSSREIL